MGGDSEQAVSGSFRDRDGRVYLHGGRVFRGLSKAALANFRVLQEKPFYRKNLEAGAIIQTRELPLENLPLPETITGQWAGFLEHDPVPVISYPYEWTFGMFKAAALLQLKLKAVRPSAGS